MAEEKETILIDLKIDKGETEKSLDAVTKAISELTEDTKKLTAANKELEKQGQTNSQAYIDNTKQIAINREELSKNQQVSKAMVVALQTESNSLTALSQKNRELIKERNNLNLATAEGVARLKQINAELDKNNAIIKENVSALEKQKMNIGAYSEAIQDALSKAGPFGQAIGGQIASFTALLNPLTASLAALSALVGLYAKSSSGARDLQMAQTQLSTTTTILANEFGTLINGANSSEGVLSKFYNTLLKLGSTTLVGQTLNLLGINLVDIADKAKDAAIAVDNLRKLELEEIDAQQQAKNALNESEKLRRDRDNTEKSYKERLDAASKVSDEINKREDILVGIQQKKLDQLYKLLAVNKDDIELQKQIKQVQFEIADIQEDSQGKRTEALNGINTLQREHIQLLLEEQDAIEAARKYAEEVEKNLIGSKIEAQKREDEARETRLEKLKSFVDTEIQIQVGGLKYVAEFNAQIDKKIAAGKKQSVDIRKQLDNDNLANASQAAGQFAALQRQGSIAYKVSASGQALIDMYRAASAAMAPPPVGAGPIFGPIFAGIAIATGLANVARINAVQFARGGRADNGVRWGTVGGRPHSQGGTKYYGEDGHVVEMERGEGWYVARPNVHTGFLAKMSQANEMDGGHAWFANQSNQKMALGGSVYVPTTSQSGIDYNRLATVIARQQIFVTVEDINAGQQRVSEISQRARVL